MNPITPALAGQKGLRGDILLELKRTQPLTASELAGIFSVSANAVRHHLKELEAESLVEYAREQRGTGAPTYTYRLSSSGEALFPTQYSEALADVLAYVAASSGRDAIRALFAERFRAHAARLRSELSEASLEEKVEAVAELLSRQGFMASWSVESDTLCLTEHNCPMREVAPRFPEICAAELDFLREVLQRDVKRESYIPDGCNACIYSIPVGPSPH